MTLGKDCHFHPTGAVGRWLRRRKLARRVRVIGRDLVHEHGKKRRYSTSEVETAWRNRGYTPDFLCYAMATFSSPEDFCAYHVKSRENCDYHAMRGEIGDLLFNGRIDFTILDVLNPATSSHEAADSGWFGDMFGGAEGGDSGGDAGGDCGGGD